MHFSVPSKARNNQAVTNSWQTQHAESSTSPCLNRTHKDTQLKSPEKAVNLWNCVRLNVSDFCVISVVVSHADFLETFILCLLESLNFLYWWLGGILYFHYKASNGVYLKICSFLAPVSKCSAVEAEKPKPFYDLECYRSWAKDLLTYSGLKTGSKYL